MKFHPSRLREELLLVREVSLFSKCELSFVLYENVSLVHANSCLQTTILRLGIQLSSFALTGMSQLSASIVVYAMFKTMVIITTKNWELTFVRIIGFVGGDHHQSKAKFSLHCVLIIMLACFCYQQTKNWVRLFLTSLWYRFTSNYFGYDSVSPTIDCVISCVGM